MHVCDSSAIIHAWDNYPIEKFPKLWDWFKCHSESGLLVFPWIVHDEVKKNALPCYEFLLKPSIVSLQKIAPSNAILSKAEEIKRSLQIAQSQYGTGVGEADIYIVSSACVMGIPLVNNEKIQYPPPRVMAKYKIPAVCGLPTVNVSSLDVLAFIKSHSPVCC